MEKHKAFYFILPFFLLALAFVVLLSTLIPYYSASSPNMPSPIPQDNAVVVYPTGVPLPNTKKYDSPSLNISFDYPVGFKVVDENNKITITNELKVVFNTQKPSKIVVDNFKVTIMRLKGSLGLIRESFYLDDNSTISRGDHIVLTGWQGVEGSGNKHYLVKVSDKEWLAINHPVYLDNDIDFSSRDLIGFLTTENQNDIVDSIISSIKITK